jgi:hypothetical protein
MNIVILEDLTGFAPADSRFAAIDDATYAGPGSPVGSGATPEAAIADLMWNHDITVRLADPDRTDQWIAYSDHDGQRTGSPIGRGTTSAAAINDLMPLLETAP